MRISTRCLLPMLVALNGTLAHATAVVTKDTVVDWFNDPVFAQVPGQAVSQVTSLGNTGGTLLPGSTASATNCVVIPEPTFSCSGASAVVHQLYDLTAANAPGSGVMAVGSAIAGADRVSMSLAVSSTSSVLAGTDALLYNIVGIDRQRLSFDVVGTSLPEFIDVDMTFTVLAAIDDQSTVTGANYLATASATLHVLDAATLSVPVFNTGSMFAPVVAGATVNLFGGPTSAMLLDVTETISVRPNAEYWVALESQATVSLTPSAGFPDRDYAGLNIAVSAYADPVFVLNPAFAALNPDIADGLQINRIAVVPVPPAALLLLSGLCGILVSGRRSRPRQA
ncbi:MAG: hypothetical protein IT324_19045 [Anaerolineae bacterium]|nr:hypothetical protein [Anaerolineae bacterium]